MIKMNKILIGTKNKGKQKEFKKFLSELQFVCIFPKDIGIIDDIEEEGKTYKENAEKKALFYAKKSGLPVIADDGGLEIDALGGAPGIHSRRWLGHRATDEKLIKHMQKVSRELPDANRKAFFRTVVSLALPNGDVWSQEGQIEGIIAKQPRTKVMKGYPYRSFFYLPKLKKYYYESELTDEEMKRYNHRYKALQKLKPIIIKSLFSTDHKSN